MMTEETRTKGLSYADRVTIASVLTWDDCQSHTYSPDEIETIRMEGEMVWVKLTGKRPYPISRYMFRSILDAQRAAINKRIDEIIEAETAEVIEAEREMDADLEEVRQEHETWLAQLEGLAVKAIASSNWEPFYAHVSYLPSLQNAYHIPFWSCVGCEF